MTFVVLTFFLLAFLLTYTTKLLRDSKRNNLAMAKKPKKPKYTTLDGEPEPPKPPVTPPGPKRK